MDFYKQLKIDSSKAVFELYQIEQPDSFFSISPTTPEFQGDFTLLIFPLTKFKLGTPQQIGETIGNWFVNNTSYISEFQLVKGFLNLKIKDFAWIEFIQNFSTSSAHPQIGNNEPVMVEYSSPNTNKPLHLGHLRNNFLGFSIASILEAVGYKVIKANLVNDRGVHICKSMLAWLKFGNGETPESSGLKGDHLVGKYYVIYNQKFIEEYNDWKSSSEAQQVLSEYLATEKAAKRLLEIAKDLKTRTDLDGESLNLSDDFIKDLAPKELIKFFWSEYKDQYANKFSVLGLETQEMLRKWEANDPEIRSLWQKMNGWVYDGFKHTYERMGVAFDQVYYESDTYLLGKQFVEQGLKENIFYQNPDNSIWIDLSDVGLDQKLVLRSDGTTVYITQDIGTAKLKIDTYHLKKSIYVIGNEQDYHMKVLKEICKKLNFPNADGIYHMSYGMVELPTGKMKSREGTVVDADDLMDIMHETAKELTQELGKTEGQSEAELKVLYEQLGMSALKYFLLKVDPTKKILFNPAESIDFKGNTGPYIQYNYVRAKSILRKATQENIEIVAIDKTLVLEECEKDLIAILVEYSNVLKDAASKYSPAAVANYIFELAKGFSSFLNLAIVLKSDEPAKRNLRLILVQATAETIKDGFKLLGIQVPEKM